MRAPVLVMCFLSMAATAQPELLAGMTPLVNGQTADANQLNDNLQIVSDQLRKIESDVNFLVDYSSRVVRVPSGNERLSQAYSRNLSGDGTAARTSEDGTLQALPSGRLYLEVDCSQDPWALVDAYTVNSHYTSLGFFIKGACYGQIYVSKEDVYTQEFSQEISIWGEGRDLTKLIARPRLDGAGCGDGASSAAGQAGVGAPLNGSLWLSGVTVELGECDGVGILYSRGAEGEMHNVTIRAHSSESTLRALEVRHNAIIYMSDVEVISGQGEVFKVWNGGAVVGLGPITVRSTGAGRYAGRTWAAACQFEAGANFFSYYSLTCTHDLAEQSEGAKALSIRGASTFRAGDVTVSGLVDVQESSNVGILSLVQTSPQSSLNIQDSYMGTAYQGSVTINGKLNLSSGATLNADSVSFVGDARLNVSEGSRFSASEITYSGSGFVFDSRFHVGSTLTFTNATDSLRIQNSSIRVGGPIDLAGGTLDCYGLGVSQFDDDDFEADPKCMSMNDWQAMMEAFKNQPAAQ